MMTKTTSSPQPLTTDINKLQGFALPLTLIIISLLSVLAMGLSQVARNQMQDIQQRKSLWEDEKQAHNIIHESLYTLLTGEHHIDSVTLNDATLFLDGSLSTLPGAKVWVQDTAGLLSLALYNQSAFQRVLQKLTTSKNALKISMELADWIDKDNNRSFRGMETANYLNAGLLQSPRNAPIRGIDELLELPSMTASIMNGSPNQPGLLQLVVAGGNDFVNIAVAPKEVLGAVLGLSEGQEQQLLAARRQKNWPLMLQLVNPESLVFNDASPFARSNRYRFIIEGGHKNRLRAQLKITPYANDRLFKLINWQMPDYKME